ncbi:ribbon-helix-helix domain-containing protein [Pseudonocardia nigra]|uniref:ribbon-helix-helix domain-containing protein n=1 Tax=Pseudonocardia nigra TaxID=1921578 RepID=UPI001C5E5141|nr:ribbon-helix-helix protein, CopG family [Pseudonocardia nigra]
MKIAVSVPDELYERADELAARLGVSRSHVYAQALEAFLQEHGEDPVTAKLDELAAQQGGPVDAAAGRRLIDAGHWEW